MASWKALLKSLSDLSAKQKVHALHALYSLGWSDEKISRYFQDAVELGDGILPELVRQLPKAAARAASLRDTTPELGDTTPKTITIVSEKADDEDLVLQKHILTFKNESNFNRYIYNGSLTPFKQVQERSTKLVAVIAYDQLEDGGCYVRNE